MAGPGAFLGDQVYADMTSEQMQEFIRVPARHQGAAGRGAQGLRGVRAPLLAGLVRPGEPVAAVHPAQRHDLRRPRHPRRLEHLADAGSGRWRPPRGGMGGSSPGWPRTGSTSTWGTCRREERAEDAIWQRIAGARGRRTSSTSARSWTLSRSGLIGSPESYRWSYCRDFGDTRLIVVDSRAARDLTPDDARDRSTTRRWPGSTSRCVAGSGTCSWHLAAVPAADGPAPRRGLERGRLAGAWGSGWPRLGEKLRQAVDLEHWGAFQNSFRQVAAMATEVADGKRGPAPRTITFLSGDVHYSYVAEVDRAAGAAGSCRRSAPRSATRCPGRCG